MTRTIPMTIDLLFVDGTLVSGATYREVESNLRASQWTVFSSKRRFRREMRRRALLWAGPGTKLPPLLCNSEKFLTSLAKAGMCRIDKTNERGLV